MIVATNNKGKLKEIKSILSDYELYSLKEKEIFIDVIEDKDTFYDNAFKKAKEIYILTKEPVIADDSGLCIEVLNDWPGILTHRFLGKEANDIERNNYILDMMKNYEEKERMAKVVCNIVYYDGINVVIGEGVLKGKISITRRGTNGFGFDEIFELDDGRTLAELSSKEKNIISARYLALMDLKEKLETTLKNNYRVIEYKQRR